MRFFSTYVCIGLIGTLAGAAGLQAQSAYVNGPFLGFTPDNAGAAIRPIMGIPGASVLGDRLQFEADIRGVIISPKQDYAIAVRVEDAQVIVIDLRDGGPAIGSVAGTHPGGNIMAISPTGSVAAVYDHESKTVQVIGNLPQAPALIHEFDASRIPGRGTNIAISDDGAIALARFVDADSAGLWVMNSAGASWPISADRPSAAAFFPNSSDAIVTDDATQSAFLIMDVGHTATRILLISAEDGISSFSGVFASEDGRQVFLADTNSGNVAVVDMETRRPVLVSCHCRTAGLYRLKGTSVFRLMETSREPMMVLDASTAEPRIVVIPPSASGGAEAQ